MIFALVLMTVGVFVLAAVLQLAATQGVSGEAEWDALQRRVMLGNSRAMAREHLRSRLFRVPQATNNWPATFTNSSGGFSIQPAGAAHDNYWQALSVSDPDVVLNINPFNLMERGGFYREVFVGQLQQGASSVGWSFALRTRSPVAAGYSFVQHRPADNDLASLASPPYIDMNGTGEQFVGFPGMPRMPMASVTNTFTRGAGDSNGYQGFLDVREGASVYGLFTNAVYQAREPSNQTPQTLQVVLDLAAADPNVANSVLRYDATDNTASFTRGTNVYNLPVKAVVLSGSGNDRGGKPLHVVVPESNTNITGLVLSNNNARYHNACTVHVGPMASAPSTNAASAPLTSSTSTSAKPAKNAPSER